MSLLWPERIVIGLFPGYCWLRRGKVVIGLEVASDAQPADLLAVFDRLLHMPGRSAHNARIEVLVSDHLAQMVTIRWQPGLMSRWLVHAYGTACLTSSDLPDPNEWIIEAGFRHPGAAGFSYALPKDLLAQIVSRAVSCGAKVTTVLPASAAAYWYSDANRVKGISLLVMSEAARISCLVFQDGQFSGFDVEPVIGSSESSLGRLAARLQATRGKPGRIAFWTAGTEPSSTMMEAVFSEITSLPIVRRHWSAHG